MDVRSPIRPPTTRQPVSCPATSCAKAAKDAAAAPMAISINPSSSIEWNSFLPLATVRVPTGCAAPKIQPLPAHSRLGIFRLSDRLPPKLGFERRDAGLQHFVFLTCQLGHFLDGLEFLAMDDIQITQDSLCLGAHDGIEFTLHAL